MSLMFISNNISFSHHKDYLSLSYCLFMVQCSHRLEKYLNIQECLEKYLKTKFALKSTENYRLQEDSTLFLETDISIKLR